MGEVSAAAEADGVEAGMPLGEALARCPSLRLVPPDPVGVAERWDRLLERLEGIGAAVESERPGEAFFEVDGLRGIHGGDLEGVLAAAREAARTPVRIGVAPNRFAALLAAGREAVVTRRAPRPVPRPAAGRDARRRARPGRAGGEGAGRDPAAARHRHPRPAGAALRRPGRRPLRAARPAGAAPRPRRGHAAAPAPPRTRSWSPRSSCPRGPRASQLDRALELLVDRLLAAPRAARPDPAGAAPLGAARAAAAAGASSRGWAGRPPRRGRCGVAAGAAARGAARAGERAAAAGARASGPPAADQLELAVGGAGAAARPARRRRCGRCARRPGRRGAAEGDRRSIPAPASPSAGRC